MAIRPVFFLPPVSDIMVWLDAADTRTISPPPTNGSAISQWSDKSGRGNHGTQTGTARPTWSSASRSIVFTSSSSQFFNLPNGAFPFGNTSYTYILVGSATQFNAGFLGGGSYNNNQAIAVRTNSGNSLTSYWWNNDLHTPGNSYIYGTRALILTDYNSGGARRFFINGSATPTASDIPGTRSQANGSNTVGRAHPDHILEGTISEFICFNRVLTDAERQSVEVYLARKWGLASSMVVNHPTAARLMGSNFLRQPFSAFFRPTQIAGCQLWLDGADPAGTGVAPANGSVVTTWVNKVAGNSNWTAAGTVNTYSASLRSIIFNGTSNARFTGNLPASYSDVSIFAVAMQTIVHGPLYSFNNEYGFHPFEGGTTFLASANNAWMTNGSTFPLNTTHLYSIIYDTNVTLWGQGSQVNSGAKGTISFGTINIASRQSPTLFTGHISEFILFSRALTVAERQTVESYLSENGVLLEG